jgi:predicted naringenin-chalcone synthase
MLLTDFHSIRPPYETSQANTLDWLADAHAAAERNPLFRSRIREKLERVGCKPEHIEKRGHVLSDFLHRDWEKMEVYRLDASPSGCDLSVRSRHFEQWADTVFESFYSDESAAPDDLIHVSCTGYVSPSGAQRLVSKKNWGRQTAVTHAYHMGCYASIPAIRMAQGFFAANGDKRRADIVHTEICSLHSNPSNHDADQLVSQSLFADGFIKYSAVREAIAPHFKVVSLKDEIIPDSMNAMTWKVSNWGFQMTLAKEVPVLIARALPEFMKRLGPPPNALFAVHPGGPKILHYVQEILHLSDRQMEHSFDILRHFGNMSSATLPHVWAKILSDESIPDKTPIVSLAFGPGLSITGAIMEKVCGH